MRRSPDAARALILDAAERVFAELTPDSVGLKDVARAAGVSHALVTHYFGTYAALVDAALERRFAAARAGALARFMSAASLGAEFPMVDALVELIADRTTVRLLAWSVLAGEPGRSCVGLGGIVDGIVARLAAAGVARGRAEVEFSVVATIAAALGLALFGDPLGRALGSDAALTLDEPTLRRELANLVRRYLRLRGPTRGHP